MESRAFPCLQSSAGIPAHPWDSSSWRARALGESSEELTWSLSGAVLGVICPVAMCAKVFCPLREQFQLRVPVFAGAPGSEANTSLCTLLPGLLPPAAA